jgi:prepilin-type N-terminal cleavage/methylation domain-containing protein
MARRSAFSLVEILVVIAIIVIIISIVVPSLGLVRTASRKTATQSLITDVSNASAQFETDNRRLPGYFSAREMGDATNDPGSGGRGFTGMQNALVDLAGGVTTSTSNSLVVGPFAAAQANRNVRVDLAQIGATRPGNKAYFAIPARNFTATTNATAQLGDQAHRDLPSLSDAFGTPLLFWSIDESPAAAPTRWQDMAQLTSNAQQARFYWASNAAILRSTSLGRQATDNNTKSLIGGAASNPAQSLAGALGSPGAPSDNRLFPLTSRGKFVVMSAGADGIFFNRESKYWKARAAEDAILDYRFNHFVPPGNPGTPRPLDATTGPFAPDMLQGFDDVITQGGA